MQRGKKGLKCNAKQPDSPRYLSNRREQNRSAVKCVMQHHFTPAIVYFLHSQSQLQRRCFLLPAQQYHERFNTRLPVGISKPFITRFERNTDDVCCDFLHSVFFVSQLRQRTFSARSAVTWPALRGQLRPEKRSSTTTLNTLYSRAFPYMRVHRNEYKTLVFQAFEIILCPIQTGL